MFSKIYSQKKKQFPQWFFTILLMSLIVFSCKKDEVNTAPEMANQSFTIAEDSSAGQVIGTLKATDADQDELSFSITTNDDNAFTLEKGTGKLSLANGAQLDYETKTSYTLTVMVTDGDLQAEATITIEITDVFENTPPVMEEQTFEASEDIDVDHIIGTVVATDVDQQTLTFSMVSNHNDIFEISTTGELSLASGQSLDYETNTSHTLIIGVNDGFETINQLIYVSVLDVFEPEAFELEFNVTKTDDDIQIPIGDNKYTYNFTVDWGDGTVESGLSAKALHRYTTTGVYTVKISGEFPHMNFTNANNNTRASLTKVKHWGTNSWKSMSSMFRGAINMQITATDIPNTSEVGNMSSIFEGCSKFNSPVANWDTSNVGNLSYAFKNTPAFNQDLNSWDVSKVVHMTQTFYRSGITGNHLKGWDVSKVKYMVNMFTLSSFNGDISGWNTTSVINMGGMFQEAVNFNQDISGWDVSNVSRFENVFYKANSFNQNMGAWKLHSATRVTYMLADSGMSRANYMATLEGWANDSNTKSGLLMQSRGLTYCDTMSTGRSTLIQDKKWEIRLDTEDCTQM